MQRDSEEVEYGRAQKFNDGQKDDVIDCDFARQRPIDGWRRFVGEPKKHESRPKRIDQRKEHAEGDQKRLPKEQEQSPYLWPQSLGPQRELTLPDSAPAELTGLDANFVQG